MSVDILMWVGKTYYPTPQDFIEESETFGCSKKIPHLPDEIEVGRSRCFCIHPSKEKPIIFGYFPITQIDLIVNPLEMSEKLWQKAIKREINIMALDDARKEPRRLCGFRALGYYIDPPCQMIILPKPWPLYTESHFRGYKLVNGDKILEGVKRKEKVAVIEDQIFTRIEVQEMNQIERLKSFYNKSYRFKKIFCLG